MELEIGQIMEILPHRQPFLLIDAVEELEPGKRAVARKCVSYNEPYFGGHFPGEPVMPGVLIVEALAQTGAVAILSMEENCGKTAYFAEINRARFKKKVVPGMCWTLTTEIIRQKGPIGIGSATASVRGEVVCTAELTFAIGRQGGVEEKWRLCFRSGKKNRQKKHWWRQHRRCRRRLQSACGREISQKRSGKIICLL